MLGCKSRALQELTRTGLAAFEAANISASIAIVSPTRKPSKPALWDRTNHDRNCLKQVLKSIGKVPPALISRRRANIGREESGWGTLALSESETAPCS